MFFFNEDQCPYESCGYASYKNVTLHIYKAHRDEPLPVNVSNRRTKNVIDLEVTNVRIVFCEVPNFFNPVFNNMFFLLQNINDTDIIEPYSVEETEETEETEEKAEESQGLWEDKSMFDVNRLHYIK